MVLPKIQQMVDDEWTWAAIHKKIKVAGGPVGAALNYYTSGPHFLMPLTARRVSGAFGAKHIVASGKREILTAMLRGFGSTWLA